MNRVANLIKESVNNLTPIGKYFLAAAVIANLPYIRDFLILTKIVALPWSPWTLVTNTIVADFFSLPPGIMFILFSLKYFENVWGKQELTNFVIVTTIVSQILLILLIFIASFFMGAQLL
jgi:hypothetical protein